jgi:uncharacterized protein
LRVKYVLVLLVVVVFGWLMLRGRGPSKASRDKAPKGQAQSMIECAHCGVHLPRSDAVLDRNGSYCCDAHKMAGPRGP